MSAAAARFPAVIHAIPGRVRLRLRRLRDDARFGEAVAAGLRGLPGVTAVRLARGASCVVVEHDPAAIDSDALVRAAAAPPPAPLGHCNGAPGVPAASRDAPASASAVSRRPLILSSAAIGLALIAGPLAWPLSLPLVAVTAAPIFRRAWDSVARRRRLNVDLLDGLAILAAVATGDVVNAAGITWLVSLGDHIRDRTQARARRAIRDLLDYQRDLAWVVRGDAKVQIPVADLVPGDIVVVYTGSVIPVDGEAVEGEAVVDQQSLTGESVPAHKGPGDPCFAATVIREGKLYVRAERVGDATKAARAVRLIEDAPALETRAQCYAEVFADRLVGPTLGVAAVTLAATADVTRLAAILTIDFGTGPRVSAPTTVLASMSAAARRGILIKGGAHLEKLAGLTTVVFDKTGTLTRGAPEITDVIVHGARSDREAITLAAAVSARQTHPVSQAVLRLAEARGVEIPDRENSRYHIGRGVEATVGGRAVQLGAARFLAERGIACALAEADRVALEAAAGSLLFLAVDGDHVATLAHRDALRPESRATVDALRARGVQEIVMLTGDTTAVARCVAEELGISIVHAEMLPEDKAEITRSLTGKGRVVAVVGDGINDSPALSYADVGVSLSAGAEIAREAAGVVLIDDDLSRLVEAIDLSREAMRLIRQSFSMILAANAVAYALSVPGLMSPVMATLFSNGSAIAACLNGLRPLLATRRGRG